MMGRAKVKVIQDLELPKDVSELRSFLKLINYYCKFIKGYSKFAALLTELLKKAHSWV